MRRSETRNSVRAKADMRRTRPGRQPATADEKKMPINIGRSAFPAKRGQDPDQKRVGTSQTALRLHSNYCSSHKKGNAPTSGALPFFVAGAAYSRQLQPLKNRSNWFIERKGIFPNDALKRLATFPTISNCTLAKSSAEQHHLFSLNEFSSLQAIEIDAAGDV